VDNIDMPLHNARDSKGSYYQFGDAKKYYYKVGDKKSREAAQKKAALQGRAIEFRKHGGYGSGDGHAMTYDDGAKRGGYGSGDGHAMTFDDGNKRGGLGAYCGADAKIPRGKQRGTMKQCRDKGQVRYFGVNKIDKRLLVKPTKTKKPAKKRVKKTAKVASIKAPSVKQERPMITQGAVRNALAKLKKVSKRSARKVSDDLIQKLAKEAAAKAIERQERVKPKPKIASARLAQMKRDLKTYKEIIQKPSSPDAARQRKLDAKRLGGITKIKKEIATLERLLGSKAKEVSEKKQALPRKVSSLEKSGPKASKATLKKKIKALDDEIDKLWNNRKFDEAKVKEKQLDSLRRQYFGQGYSGGSDGDDEEERERRFEREEYLEEAAERNKQADRLAREAGYPSRHEYYEEMQRQSLAKSRAKAQKLKRHKEISGLTRRGTHLSEIRSAAKERTSRLLREEDPEYVLHKQDPEYYRRLLDARRIEVANRYEELIKMYGLPSSHRDFVLNILEVPTIRGLEELNDLLDTEAQEEENRLMGAEEEQRGREIAAEQAAKKEAEDRKKKQQKKKAAEKRKKETSKSVASKKEEQAELKKNISKIAKETGSTVEAQRRIREDTEKGLDEYDRIKELTDEQRTAYLTKKRDEYAKRITDTDKEIDKLNPRLQEFIRKQKAYLEFPKQVKDMDKYTNEVLDKAENRRGFSSEFGSVMATRINLENQLQFVHQLIESAKGAQSSVAKILTQTTGTTITPRQVATREHLERVKEATKKEQPKVEAPKKAKKGKKQIIVKGKKR
jgi:hypothetical protein